MGRGRSHFHPRMVDQIRKGFFYHPSLDTGLGTTSFTVIEGNKNSKANAVQATVASQPTLLTANGQKQYRYSDAGDGTDSRIITSAFQAGWTLDTYLACWVSMSEGTPTNGTTTIFSHNSASNPLRRISVINNGTTDVMQMAMSTDGIATVTNTWSYTDIDFQFCEWIFVPGSCQMFKGFVLQTPATNNINITSLNDPATPLGIGTATGAAQNQNKLDRGSFFYGNGIPTLKNRKRLANWLAPVNTKFSI